MKNLVKFAAIIAALVFASCENRIENEISFSAGPAEKETVVLRDTFVTIEGDTVVVKENIECYELLKNNLMALALSSGDLLEVSFNTNLSLEKKMYFSQEAKGFELKNKRAYFFNNHAHFTVCNGTEEKTVDIFVLGGSSLKFGENEITPCNGKYIVDADTIRSGDTVDGGKSYRFAEILYTLRKENSTEDIATAKQIVLAPMSSTSGDTIPENKPEEPENKRNVDITGTPENGMMVINVNITNTLFGDTITQALIPLNVEIECGAPIYESGKNFNLEVGTPVSGETQRFQKEYSDEYMTVTYNEVVTTWTTRCTASGKTVTTTQITRHYEDFMVTLVTGDEEFVAGPTISVMPQSKTEGPLSINTTAGTAEKVITIPFKAQQSGKIASAEQEIVITINDIIAFDDETIVYGNRSISFNEPISKALIFDCLLTEGSNGKYYYRYRELGQALWKRIELSGKAEFDWLLAEAKKANQGLANYYYNNESGWKWLPGVVRSKDVRTEVIHFNYNNGKPTHKTKDHIALRTLIDGVGVDKAVIYTLSKYEGKICQMGDVLYLANIK